VIKDGRMVSLHKGDGWVHKLPILLSVLEYQQAGMRRDFNMADRGLHKDQVLQKKCVIYILEQ
jgi:hypothetical protein